MVARRFALAKRVLVTGGAGFVGSHIVDALLDQGHHVLVVDDLSTGDTGNLPANVDLLELGVGGYSFRREAKRFQPDAIVHCAAQASVAVSMQRPAFDAEVNVVAGLNTLTAAAESDCQQFVYINTGGALYGQPQYLPCDEDHPIRPISAYGLSKWTLECYLSVVLPRSIASKVLRLANVYGPRQDPNGEAGVVAIFGLQMLQNGQVKIFGDGEQTRDFVHVSDVAQAVCLALGSDRALTVNIGSGTALSVNDLFKKMAGSAGYAKPPEYHPERPGDVKHVVLDCRRAEKLLGWRATTSMERGLNQTFEWLRASGIEAR
jgi:UDP-glucose 4-epimerase